MNKLAVPLVLVLALTGCGGSSSSSTDDAAVATTGSAEAQTITVDMTDSLTFVPKTVTARVGTVTITAANIGRVPHNLVFSEAGLGKTGTIGGEDSEPLKLVFDKAGTFAFVCTFHPGMTGKVVVS